MLVQMKSQYIPFAYSVKFNTKNGVLPTEADYNTFFNTLAKFNITVEYKISELDSKKRLHYHGIIYLRKGFYRKKICPKGYGISLKEVWNKKGWEKYIHKDCAFTNLPDSPTITLPKRSLFRRLKN